MNNRVIALGFFDGVHLGHAALLKKTRERADVLGLSAAAMSFDTHPDTLVFGCEVPLLNTAEERQWLMKTRFGIDEVILAHFDEAMMHMSWQDFVTGYLLDTLHAKHLVCGHDFHFGSRGEGTPERLAELCRTLGLGCDVIGKVTLDGQCVSSTYIRQLLQQGQTERAVRFLGHRHLLSGTVEHGAHRGSGIGFPTANLTPSPGVLLPARGVYLAQATTLGRTYRALVNIGVHPTAGALPKPVVEVWLQGFSGSIYGERLFVELAAFLRPEQPFSDMRALRRQLLLDKIKLEEYPF